MSVHKVENSLRICTKNINYEVDRDALIDKLSPAELTLSFTTGLVKNPVALPDPSTLDLMNKRHINLRSPLGEPRETMTCSIQELLQCFMGCVGDHQDAHDLLVLHRDISCRNLMIFEDDDDNMFGRLNYCDHGKKGAEKFTIKKASPCAEDVQLVKTFLQAKGEITEFQVNDDAICEARKYVVYPGSACGYLCEAITKRKDKLAPSILGKADLGWEHEGPRDEWPCYAGRLPSDGERAVSSWATTDIKHNLMVRRERFRL
ncbi:hypothetical protein H0H87_011177 [Tephrocybe sp. NHM501043]|nr:hypothetical protein H0H87_011177 [Tephrocybe sp. NHM501043]